MNAQSEMRITQQTSYIQTQIHTPNCRPCLHICMAPYPNHTVSHKRLYKHVNTNPNLNSTHTKLKSSPWSTDTRTLTSGPHMKGSLQTQTQTLTTMLQIKMQTPNVMPHVFGLHTHKILAYDITKPRTTHTITWVHKQKQILLSLKT
jgi:hypothetical protein